MIFHHALIGLFWCFSFLSIWEGQLCHRCAMEFLWSFQRVNSLINTGAPDHFAWLLSPKNEWKKKYPQSWNILVVDVQKLILNIITTIHEQFINHQSGRWRNNFYRHCCLTNSSYSTRSRERNRRVSERETNTKTHSADKNDQNAQWPMLCVWKYLKMNCTLRTYWLRCNSYDALILHQILFFFISFIS